MEMARNADSGQQADELLAAYAYDAAVWPEFDAAYGRLFARKQIDPMCCVFPLGLMNCACDCGGRRLREYARGQRKYEPTPVPKQPDGTPKVALRLTKKGIAYNSKSLTWDNVDLKSVRVIKSTPQCCACFLSNCASGRVVPIKRLPGPESLHWQMIYGMFFPCLVSTCCHEHVPGYWELSLSSKSVRVCEDAEGMTSYFAEVDILTRALKGDPDEVLQIVRDRAKASTATAQAAASTAC